MLTPENRLWRAVLEQAFADAELPGDPEHDFVPAEQVRARNYLRADRPSEAANLYQVCDGADLPADRLISWARKRYTPPAQELS